MLLIERGRLDGASVREALRATFSTRGTHQLPERLPPPPGFWSSDFPGMAEEAGLSTRDYLEAFAILERYWAENTLGGD